ncbi:hypothetical protein ACFZAM_31635 [Streptomyces sp. NPDC008079]|uniref:hypothetical protein n=1 Tax=Streptomyces sp. NPDC008079 TaxID=3364806 RepID=UPI0036EE4B45
MGIFRKAAEKAGDAAEKHRLRSNSRDLAAGSSMGDDGLAQCGNCNSTMMRTAMGYSCGCTPGTFVPEGNIGK